jgi:hypothetical protein
MKFEREKFWPNNVFGTKPSIVKTMWLREASPKIDDGVAWNSL